MAIPSEQYNTILDIGIVGEGRESIRKANLIDANYYFLLYRNFLSVYDIFYLKITIYYPPCNSSEQENLINIQCIARGLFRVIRNQFFRASYSSDTPSCCFTTVNSALFCAFEGFQNSNWLNVHTHSRKTQRE